MLSFTRGYTTVLWLIHEFCDNRICFFLLWSKNKLNREVSIVFIRKLVIRTFTHLRCTCRCNHCRRIAISMLHWQTILSRNHSSSLLDKLTINDLLLRICDKRLFSKSFLGVCIPHLVFQSDNCVTKGVVTLWCNSLTGVKPIHTTSFRRTSGAAQFAITGGLVKP